MKKTDGLICLTLMNKNTKILDFDYDQEIHAVIHIDAIYNKDYAPLAIQNEKQGITRAQLNSWWKGRSIPASRDNYEAAMIELGISSSEELVEKCNGLSLSDQYWVKECDSSLNWGDINFFHNNFSEDVGKILVGQGTDSKEISLVSPDNTSDGNLIKKWKIIDGKRCLIKGGTHKNQEPYNEVIATKLYERLFDINEFVKYELYEEDNRAFSKCETMISTDEELVSAYSIISFYKCPSHISIYEHYLSSCEKLGIKNAREKTEKMIVADYILGNYDRHFKNFGAIRNIDTLEWKGIAPIFDSGSSLWANTDSVDSYVSKPFRKEPGEQLKLVKDLSWFDKKKLAGFSSEAMEILKENRVLSASRIMDIGREIDKRIEDIMKLKRQQ